VPACSIHAQEHHGSVARAALQPISMSLASLLNFGKKDKAADVEEEAPIPAIDEYEAVLDSKEKDEKPPPKFSAPSLNLEELKLAQELAQTQSKVMEPEFERRKKEEEDAQKAQLEQAAAKAKELAKQARDNPTLFKDGGMYRASFANSNPFSTGGADFKKGVFVCDTAFGTPKPLGARSFMPEETGAQSSDDRDRSRSPVRDPWSAGGCAAFSPAWTGPQHSSESSAGPVGAASGSYGKGGYGCAGGYDAWGGGCGGCGGCGGWGAPAWGGGGGEWFGGKGACGGYDYGPPGGYGRGPPMAGYGAGLGYGGRPPVGPIGYGGAPGYGAPGVPGYGVRQTW